MARGLGSVLAAIVLLSAVAGVLAHGADFDGRLDLLAHFAPLYMAVALVGAAIALIARLAARQVILIASAAGIVASGALIAPEFSRSDRSGASFDPSGQIKVIQINALRTNADIGRVADWLIAEHPDVVTISEARHDLRDLLVKRAGWSTAGAHGSLMIFTREPYVTMNRPDPGGAVSFVNATYAIRGGAVEVVTAHLDWPTSPAVAGHVRGLENTIRQLPRERMILTGDFNATPWSAGMRRLDASLGLIRRDRAVASWPAQLFGRPWPLPVLPIDHIYAGPGWVTVKVERGPWLGSDHYPLIVTLAPASRP